MTRKAIRKFTAAKVLTTTLMILISLNALALPKNLITGANLSTGKTVTVNSENKKGLVVVFLSAKCPCSNSHVVEITNLAKEFTDFNFVAVHSNKDEPIDLTKEYFLNTKLPFAVIQDQDTKIADEFKAFKTPHAYIILADNKVAYQGGVSDSNNFAESKKKYLREALTDINDNKPVRTPEGRTLGCSISRGGFF